MSKDCTGTACTGKLEFKCNDGQFEIVDDKCAVLTCEEGWGTENGECSCKEPKTVDQTTGHCRDTADGACYKPDGNPSACNANSAPFEYIVTSGSRIVKIFGITIDGAACYANSSAEGAWFKAVYNCPTGYSCNINCPAAGPCTPGYSAYFALEHGSWAYRETTEAGNVCTIGACTNRGSSGESPVANFRVSCNPI
jgi:hypothetical protein